MISLEEIRTLAETRLKDARILHANKSHHGAIYLCGYAIELGLKAVVCKSLNQGGTKSISHIPGTKKEFDTVESLLTHKLDDLSNLVPSNVIKDLRTKYTADWSIVQEWNPEMRYGPVRRGKTVKKEAEDIIKATARLLRYLKKQI